MNSELFLLLAVAGVTVFLAGYRGAARQMSHEVIFIEPGFFSLGLLMGYLNHAFPDRTSFLDVMMYGILPMFGACSIAYWIGRRLREDREKRRSRRP